MGSLKVQNGLVRMQVAFKTIGVARPDQSILGFDLYKTTCQGIVDTSLENAYCMAFGLVFGS
jgi:hypothetical protein